MVDGRLPTVPEYYVEHINNAVDLTASPKQCCPFHKEDTPSFSYNPATGRWSCFGKCHAHGDVIDMHMRYYHYSSREEAEHDLNVRYNVPRKNSMEALIRAASAPLISEEKVEDNVLYGDACRLANCPERWLELDYVMSKVPFDRNELQSLIYKWRGKKSALED